MSTATRQTRHGKLVAFRGNPHEELSELTISINGTSYALNGCLHSVHAFSGDQPSHTGEVRITSNGNLIARVCANAAPPVLESQIGRSAAVAELLERVAPSVPKPLARLIDSCLHTEPATRPTALEVVECLENIQSPCPPLCEKRRAAGAAR